METIARTIARRLGEFNAENGDKVRRRGKVH